MKYFFTCLLYFSFQQMFFSQENNSLLTKKDSLKNQLERDSTRIFRYQKIRPYLNIDSRNAFLTPRSLNFIGVQLGTVLVNKHTFGIGGYTNVFGSRKGQKIFNDTVNAIRKIKARYLVLFYKYSIINKRYFEWNWLTEFGLGNYNLELKQEATKVIYYNKLKPMYPVGSGFLFIYKPISFIGFVGMLGYRFMPNDEDILNYNNAYYSLSIWLDFRQTLRAIKFYGFKKPKYKRELRKLNF
jgi:hypothetical protein